MFKHRDALRSRGLTQWTACSRGLLLPGLSGGQKAEPVESECKLCGMCQGEVAQVRWIEAAAKPGPACDLRVSKADQTQFLG